MKDLKFDASGKLLLFGEYLVLRGAQSIAIPLSVGQSLTVTSQDSGNILWECFENSDLWLQIEFSPEFLLINTTNESKAVIVQQLLQLIHKENPSLNITGLRFKFNIDFNRNYGFGTSSTFISLLSQWSGLNPYYLLEKSFGGSGFDIAAATSKTPFVYQVKDLGHNANRIVKPFNFSKKVNSQLLFVYTGKKQKSSREVSSFNNIRTSNDQINDMNTIVKDVLRCTNIEVFESMADRSEQLLAGILNNPPVKVKLFSDYPYSIKSLGAWGGDFVMATFRDEQVAREYFEEKGMIPIFNYQQLIKK